MTVGTLKLDHEPPWSALIAGGENLSYGSSSGGEDGKLLHLPEGSPLWCAISRTSHVFHPTAVLVRLAHGRHCWSTAVAVCLPDIAAPGMLPRLGARDGVN